MIGIYEIPSATWILEDDTFHCQHDDGVDVEKFEADTMVNGEHSTHEAHAAVCADPDCREDLSEDFDWTSHFEPDNDGGYDD